MELILLEKVKNLGDLGDKVKVKPGYGRNYLLPQGKAVRTTAANLEAFEQRRAEYEAKARKQLGDAETRKTALDGTEIIISAHASPEGKLYGSVGPREIVAAMTARNLEVDKGEIVLPEGAIHNTGEYEAHVVLHADVQATIKITVNAD